MKKIFVVDDNLTNLQTAKNELESYYQVFTMSSAIKMIGLLEKITPNLILLDIKMPEMDGFEALAYIKANTSYSDIPVIFLTSDTDAAIEARGFELGVINFITKPFSPPVLLNRIKTHLERDNGEYEKMKLHTTEGARMIEKMIEKMIEQTGEVEFMNNAKLFAEYHHERWDGTGYSNGLMGTNIPLQGRIMAIVDVFDALVSKRPYKEALTVEDAIQIIKNSAGKHFDPSIVGVFLEVQDQLKTVREVLCQ